MGCKAHLQQLSGIFAKKPSPQTGQAKWFKWLGAARNESALPYGWVVAHYAVRWLMHSAGSVHDVEPRRLSFVAKEASKNNLNNQGIYAIFWSWVT